MTADADTVAADRADDDDEIHPDAATAVGPRRLVAESAAVATIAWVWAALAMRVWDMPMRLPWDTRSDATLISMMVKNVTERGTYNTQPRLGAPYGQQFYDFPHGGEQFQLWAMQVLTTVTGDWGLSINLYFWFGFGFLAVVTFLVLRHLRVGPVIAGVAALIYTFLPFHFIHGEQHLWRSTYFTAPLAALLLVWAGSWRERFLVDPSWNGWRGWRSALRWPRVAAAAAVAVVVAGSETMTTAFAMTLLASGAVVGAIRWREAQRLVVAGALILVMALTFAVLSLPTLNHYRVNGTNEVAARRIVTESEWYGVKLTRLVTPQGGHRSGVLSDLGDRSQEDSIVPSEGGQALGILGTAGFFGILYGAVVGQRRLTRRQSTLPGWHRRALFDHAVVNTLLALVFGVVGGLSVLLAMAGFSQVRVWNRIMLIIAFFCMVTVAMWGERLAAWVRPRVARPRAVLGGLAVAVLAFGLWDGIPQPRLPYEEIEARHASDRAFVREIEERLGDEAAIFQLPVLEFPEVIPPAEMLDYDPLRGFLADSGGLRWSYGSIKGRPEADWQVRLRDHVGPVGALPALHAMGFTGLWVDTFGYDDGGAEIAAIEGALGVEPLVSPDGRFLFYDLRPHRASLDRTDEELRDEARALFGVEPPESPGG